MASDSFSLSSGFSNPEIMNSAQSDWSLQLSQMLATMGQAQMDWASQEYDRGLALTSQNVDRYLQGAGQGTALASQLMTQYRDVFEPIMNDYVAQAKSYNSPERQRFEMGRAESTVAQADQAARDAAERKLQGFGINPNSGRYQDLILTGRLQDAAARAGAGTEASLATAAVGRQMTEKAAQMGQNVPGMTVNALNSANQGIAGAQGAMQGMLNTGANLKNMAGNFMNIAGQANRLPPIGNRSQQQSVSRSQNDSGGSGSGSGKGGQGDKNPYPTDAYKDIRDFNNDLHGGKGGPGGGSFGPKIINVHGTGRPEEEPPPPPPPGGEEPPWWLENAQLQPQKGGPDDQDWNTGFDNQYQSVTDPTSEPDVSQWNTDQPTDRPDMSWDQFDNSGTGQDASNDSGGDWGDDSGQFDASQGYQEPDQSDYSGGDEGYAQGGGVLDARTVPPSASQSGGRQTDDVPARLNVGEYVIPKDVVTHKGHEFFQNVIKKSRQSRLGMSGPEPRGQMKPALRMRPTFSTANRV